MITLFEIWEKFIGEYNTHQGGHVRPHRNFVNWVNDISLEIFGEKYLEWQKSQASSDHLAKPFLRSTPTILKKGTKTYDILEFPSDYGHFSSCRYIHKGDFKPLNAEDLDLQKTGYYYTNTNYHEVTIELVDNDRWGAIGEHRFKSPKITRPFMTQYQGGFKIAPIGIGTVIIDYLKEPDKGTFLYTLGVGDQIIYDTASKPLEWSPLVMKEFMSRLGMKYGKFIREPLIYQTSEKEK